MNSRLPPLVQAYSEESASDVDYDALNGNGERWEHHLTWEEIMAKTEHQQAAARERRDASVCTLPKDVRETLERCAAAIDWLHIRSNDPVPSWIGETFEAAWGILDGSKDGV